MNKSAEEITVHELKTWPEYFQAIKSGKKTFEVRKNDRSFKVGDVLLLKEWKPKGYSDVSPNELTGSYTGEELKVVVNYIMQTMPHEISSFGIPSDVVVMSISLSTKANGEALGVEKPMKICYCGSLRVAIEAFKRAEYESVINGDIALLPCCMYVDIEREYGADSDYKIKADILHKRKIDICDKVVVLNVGGYIGESTRSEIEYAKSIGKPIEYLEQTYPKEASTAKVETEDVEALPDDMGKTENRMKARECAIKQIEMFKGNAIDALTDAIVREWHYYHKMREYKGAAQSTVPKAATERMAVGGYVLLEDLANAIEKSGCKVTFGIQPNQIKRIEEEKGSNPDMRFSTHFWEKMGKEFGWHSFTLALYYFDHLLNSEKAALTPMKDDFAESSLVEWLTTMKNQADEYESKLNKEEKTLFGCFYLGKAAAFNDVLLKINTGQGGKKLAPLNEAWISVEDEKPPLGQRVIIGWEGNGVSFACRKNGDVYVDPVDNWKYVFPPTHWKPLPEPPTKTNMISKPLK